MASMLAPTTTNRSPYARLIAAAFAGAVLLGLSGCGILVGAGAATGIAAMEERGIEGAARDTKIAAAVTQAWWEKDTRYVTKFGVEVYEARALITGAVDDPQMHADAIRLVWTVDGVKDVIDEVQDSTSDVNPALDTLITTQLRSKLTFDREVFAINYEIETVGAVIYLIGIAQNQAELDRVLSHARDLPRVKRVISHVRVKGA
jgi:osmotically-inducible protein OsmY